MVPEIIMMCVIAYMVYDVFKNREGNKKYDFLIGVLVFTVILFWGGFFNDTVVRGIKYLYVKCAEIFN